MKERYTWDLPQLLPQLTILAGHKVVVGVVLTCTGGKVQGSVRTRMGDMVQCLGRTLIGVAQGARFKVRVSYRGVGVGNWDPSISLPKKFVEKSIVRPNSLNPALQSPQAEYPV